jgi:predicted thioesterase
MAQTGQSATVSYTVTDDDTAVALGSGDVAVLATPRLLAWCEAVTCEAAREAVGDALLRTSVGTRVSLEHLCATRVGGRVAVTATLDRRDGRLLHFGVVAVDAGDRLVATAEVTRVVVDRERFADRVPPV